MHPALSFLEEIMNLSRNMKRLQQALLSKGFILTIGRSQFFSEEKKKYINVNILGTKIEHFNTKKRCWETKNYEILRTASQIEALECVLEIYKAVVT